MKLKVPYTNILHNKIDTNTKQVPLASKPADLYFNKILAIKEAAEYIKAGRRVPVDLINEVNIYEIQKQLQVSQRDETSKVTNSEFKIFNSAVPDEFQNLTVGRLNSISNTASMAMKAKIEHYKMMTPNYTLMEFQKPEYISPTMKLSHDIGKSNDYILDTLATDVVDSKSDISADKALGMFNPLNVNQQGHIVRFIDEYTDRDVNVILTPKNNKKILDKFGSINTSKAKEYVKDWYNEAAYKVGYVEANRSQTGFISAEEAKDLRNIYILDKDANIKDIVSTREYFESPYKQNSFIKKFGYYNNINDFINKSIELDNDMNGKLEYKDLLGKEANAILRAFHKSPELDVTDINKYIPSHETKRFIAKASENELNAHNSANSNSFVSSPKVVA
jgi:hypothetical protein